MRVVLLLPPFVGMVILLLRWPPLGFLLLIAASMLLKTNVPFIGLSAALIALLTALWLFDMIARQRKILLIRSPVIAPVLLFAAVTLLAFGIGQFPWYPISPAPMEAQIGGLGIIILLLCVFLLAAHQIIDLRWLKSTVYLFLALGSIIAIAGLLPGPIHQEISSHFHNKVLGGSLFWIWLVALTISQLIFNKELNWRWRLLLGIVLVGVFFLRLIQGRSWSSGWMPGFISIIVILWIGAPRWALPLTIICGIGLLASYQEIYDAVILADNEYSAITRLEAWRIVGEIVKVNPILGLGPANYRFYTPLFSILGWFVQFNSHNNYVDIAAQTGLLGLACFLWLMWRIGKLSWQMRNKVAAGGFEQAYVYGCIGGLAGMLVAGMLGDWVLPFVYNIGLEGMRSSALGWLFLGGLVAVGRRYQIQEPIR
jgi:O-antigen ligase